MIQCQHHVWLKTAKGQILHKQKSMLKGAYKAPGQMFSAAPLSHCLCGLGPPVCVHGQAPRQLRGLLIQPAIISSEKKR